MNTYALLGLLALGGMMLMQFFCPTLISGIMTGLSYGSVKALLETWAANRKQRKEDRQKKRAERRGGGLLGRRRRSEPETKPEPAPTPETKPEPAPKVDQSVLSAILGADTAEEVDVKHGQVESPANTRLLQRLEERRHQRRDRRRGR